MGQTPQERRKLANRASALRKKKFQGKELTISEEKELAEWDAIKNPRMGKTPKYDIPKKVELKEGDPPTKVERVESGELSSMDQTRTPSSEESSPVQEVMTPPPPPPPPPQVVSPRGTVGGDWRAKYGGEQMSREQACTIAARLWINGLKKLNDQIAEQERTPFLSNEFLDSEIYNACVLTVDHVLPPDFTVTPQVTAAAGTTVVLVQRAYVAYKPKKKKAPEPVTDVKQEVVTEKQLDKAEKAHEEVEAEKRRTIDDSYELNPKDVL